MKFCFLKISIGLAVALTTAQSWSTPVVVAASAPDLTQLLGDLGNTQVDPTLSVSFGGHGFAFDGYKVTRIEWWGFEAAVPPSPAPAPAPGPAPFLLLLNTNPVLVIEDVIAIDEEDFDGQGDLFRYSVDTSALDLFLTLNNTLSLGNTDPADDTVWIWQQGLGQQPYAFRVFGEAVTQVPEPSSALLVAIAGFGLLATRRRQV
jgi:hypothetical protein